MPSNWNMHLFFLSWYGSLTTAHSAITWSYQKAPERAAQELMLHSQLSWLQRQHQLPCQFILFWYFFLSFYYIWTELYSKSNQLQHWQGDKTSCKYKLMLHQNQDPLWGPCCFPGHRVLHLVPCSPIQMTPRQTISSSTKVLKLSSGLERRDLPTHPFALKWVWDEVIWLVGTNAGS